jgi:hypothetical protein
LGSGVRGNVRDLVQWGGEKMLGQWCGGKRLGFGRGGVGEMFEIANICPPKRKCLGRVRGNVWDLDIPGVVPHGPDILIHHHKFTEVF